MAINVSNIFSKLQAAERQGDLTRQYALLKNALVETRHLGLGELKEALHETSEQALAAGPPLLTCVLDQAAYALRILKGAQPVGTIQLPRPEGLPDFASLEWNPAGQIDTHILMIRQSQDSDKAAMEIQASLPGSRQNQYGLTLSQKQPYLNTDVLQKQLAQAYAEDYLWGYSAQQPLAGYPLEMTASLTGGKVAVADRGAGVIYLADILSGRLLHRCEIRQARQLKRLHMTFATDNQFLYATDNETNHLYQLNTLTGQHQILPVEVPICGNLLYNRSQPVLHLLALDRDRKTIVLCQCDPATGQIVSRTPLPGEAFSLGNDPGDLMALSPTGKYLIAMTSMDTPILYTPVLHLINLETGQVEGNMTLEYNRKPQNLAMRSPQAFPPHTSLRQRLLAEGFIEQDVFNRALGIEETEDTATFYTPGDGGPTAPAGAGSPGAAGGAAGQASDSEEASFNVPMGGAAAGGGSAPGRQAHDGFQKLNPAKVVKNIYETCVAQFANKTGIQLKEEEHGMACDRLRSACEKARNDLVYEDKAILKVTALVEEHDLEVELDRSSVLGAVQAEETKPKAAFQAVCQECGRPLPGQGDCTFCHPPEEQEQQEEKGWQAPPRGEEDAPAAAGGQPAQAAPQEPSIVERMLAKKVPLTKTDMMAKLNQGSQQASAGLTFWLADKTRNQALEVDANKQTLWKYGGFGAPADEKLKQPNRLEKTLTGTYLIADTGQGRVLEIAADKSVLGLWSAHISGPQSALRLTNGDTLVADGERVLRLTPDDEIAWQYADNLGSAAYAAPTAEGHILVTDRGQGAVLEVDQAGQVVWRYDGLQAPEQAVKLPDGHCLIADTGHNRVIEVSPAGEIVWEFAGKPKGGMHLLFKEPTAVSRNPAGNTVIVHSSQRKALELAPDTSLVWQNSGAGLAL